MPTLQNFNGRSLAVDLSQAFAPVVQGARIRNQQKQQEAKSLNLSNLLAQAMGQETPDNTKLAIPGVIDESGAVATRGDGEAAFSRIQELNPEVAETIQVAMSSENPEVLSQILVETQKGAAQADEILGLPDLVSKRRALTKIAQDKKVNNEDMTRVVELANLSEPELDLQLRKMQVVGNDITTLFGSSQGPTPAQRQAIAQLAIEEGPETAKFVADTLGITEGEGFTLSQGQQRFDEDGNLIASVDPKSDVLSPEALDQKKELARIEAEATAQIQNLSPQALANLALTEERTREIIEKRQERAQQAEQDQEKFLQGQQKVTLARNKVNNDLDEFITLANEIANDPDLSRVTGPVDQFISRIPSSKGADIRAKLTRLEALSAFGSLQEMRTASPTGGALGQVSERELDLLKNAKAAISTTQSYDQLKSELLRLSGSLTKVKSDINSAYEIDYGEPEKIEIQQEETLSGDDVISVGEFKIRVK